jgi:hypothetical protein
MTLRYWTRYTDPSGHIPVSVGDGVTDDYDPTTKCTTRSWSNGRQVPTTSTTCDDGSISVGNTSSGVSASINAQGDLTRNGSSTVLSGPPPNTNVFTYTMPSGGSVSCGQAASAGGYGRTCTYQRADGGWGVIGAGGFRGIDAGGNVVESGIIDRNNFNDFSEGTINVVRAAIELAVGADYTYVAEKYDSPSLSEGRWRSAFLPSRSMLDRGELKHQNAIERWAKFNGINPMLLAALMYHEGGEYIGSAARRQVAMKLDRFSTSKGMMQIQIGTARNVLQDIYGETPGKNLDQELIQDDDFSIKVAAGYVKYLTTRYSISDDRSLFLAYSASEKSINALKEVGFDPMSLSTADGTKRGSTSDVSVGTREILGKRNETFWVQAVQAVRVRVL